MERPPRGGFSFGASPAAALTRLAGDRIVARNTGSGTHRGAFLGIAPTGKQITIRTIDIWRVASDKLPKHWDVIDLGALEKQLREI
jgi:predicted ester cyclase